MVRGCVYCSSGSIRFNKRAQLFLLAAVIISAVIISLGVNINKAKINREPGNFEDLGYSVKREAGAVVDYKIYTNIQEDNLTNFVEVLASNIRDSDPNTNFIFIYGDTNGVTLRNYGTEEVFTSIDDDSVRGSNSPVFNRVCMGESCWEPRAVARDFREDMGVRTWSESELEGVENISVEVRGHKFSFPISKYKQVIFLMQKDVKNETFVTVE